MKNIALAKNAKKILFTMLLLTGVSIYSQDSTKSKFSFSGSIDTYFRSDLNGLNRTVPIIVDGEEVGSIAPSTPATSFANKSGFALGMANFIASWEGEKFGAVADLVYGPRGEEAVFGSPVGSSNIINQLYVYWKPNSKLTITLGDFNTYLGYEVISPTANFNYSTSYLFSYGPFSHAGIKADFDLGNGFSAMLAVLNATDFTDSNPFGNYSAGAQLGYADQYLNLLYGKQSTETFLINGVKTEMDTDPLFQIDYTGGFNLSKEFYLGINASYQDTSGSGFYGTALYPQYTFSETFALGLRAEYFKELKDGGPVYGADAETWAFTLTGDYTYGNFTIKPEFRFDQVSKDVFINPDLEPQDNLASLLIAAIYSF